MSTIKEIIAATVFPVVKAVGIIEMKDVLSQIKTNNTPAVYLDTLQALHANFSLLKQVTIQTQTSIDDGIVDLVLEAVDESAAADGIVLS